MAESITCLSSRPGSAGLIMISYWGGEEKKERRGVRSITEEPIINVKAEGGGGVWTRFYNVNNKRTWKKMFGATYTPGPIAALSWSGLYNSETDYRCSPKILYRIGDPYHWLGIVLMLDALPDTTLWYPGLCIGVARYLKGSDSVKENTDRHGAQNLLAETWIHTTLWHHEW